jgi:hypothetical protein
LPLFSCVGGFWACCNGWVTNPGVPIVVLHSGLSDRQKKSFGSVIFIEISSEFCISQFFCGNRPDVPDAAFLRLYIDEIDDFDTVIYVDGDAVVLEKLDHLFAAWSESRSGRGIGKKPVGVLRQSFYR